MAPGTNNAPGCYAMIAACIERHRERAFTRADLLALVVVLSSLGVLTVKALCGTQIHDHAAGCLGNLRRLTHAWLLYADDHQGYFPSNVDDGRSNWVSGGMGNSADSTNVLYLVDGRFAKLGPYSRDASLYRCPADPSTVRFGTNTYPRVRTYSMNQAVGTKTDGVSPVDGPWLDGNHSHTANRTWYTFAKLSDVIRPSPSRLWILIDEDEYSINDGSFAVAMTQPTQMIDWPATRHNVSGVVAFGDGHAEIHRWKDSRTIVRNGNVTRVFQANNEDIVWVQEHTTSLVIKN